MAVSQTFNVLSAFKFHIGGALAQGQTLGNSLDKLSNKAEELNEKLKFSAVHWGAQLTGTQFGILGFFRNVLDLSNDAYEAQRKMATLMVNNQKYFRDGPKDMATAMKTSAMLMKEIGKDANKFGIDSWEHLKTIQSLTAYLVKQPGGTGMNLERSIALARNVALGTEMLPGLDNIDIPTQLFRLVTGNVDQRQTLFRTLRDDTTQFKGMSASRFSGLSTDKRVDLINKAMKELVMNSDALAYRTRGLNVAFTILKNQFQGVDAVTKKLGDVFRENITKNVQGLIRYSEKLRPVFDNISKTLSGLIGDKSLVDLYFQLKNVASIGKSFKDAKIFSAVAFGLFEVFSVLMMFPRINRAIMTGLGFLSKQFGSLVLWLGITGSKLRIFSFIFSALTKYLGYFITMFTASRIWEKAKVIGQKITVDRYANDMGNLTAESLRLAEALSKLKAPFTWFTDETAKMLGVLTAKVFWIEKIGMLLGKAFGDDVNTTADAIKVFHTRLNTLANYLMDMASIFVVLATKLEPFMGTITGLAVGGSFGPVGSAIAGIGGIGFDVWRNWGKKNEHDDLSFFEKVNIIRESMSKSALKAAEEKAEDKEKPKNLYNIGKVEIRNQFAENFDSDRVAITMLDLFEKGVNQKVGSSYNNPIKTVGLQTRVR